METNQAGQYIEQAFNKLVEMYYAQLERQTTYSELYQYLYQNMDMDAQGNISYDTKEIIEIFTEAYAQDKKAGKEQAVRFFSNVKNCGMFQWIKVACRILSNKYGWKVLNMVYNEKLWVSYVIS